MCPAADPSLGPALDFLQELWRLNHALERLSARMERTMGITAQQRLLVRCLGRMPVVTAGRLAEVLHVDPGTVSAALRRLELKGIVRRTRPPDDRRRVLVTLTARGRALDRPADGTVEQAVETLLTSLPRRHVRATRRALTELTVLMDQARAPAARRARSSRQRRA